MPTCGTITIEEQFSAANVSIASCTPDDSTVAPGERTRVRVRLVNANPKGATVEVRALLNGAPVASETKSVIPNGELSFSIPFTAPTSPGDVSVSTQIVGSTASSTASSTTGSGWLARAFATPVDRERGGLVTVSAPASASASASCCGGATASRPRGDYIPAGAPGGPVCHAFAAFRQARGR
jgi:hypothetical protein